jgi:hypothetical protein
MNIRQFMDLHNTHNLESTDCYDAETGQNTNEVVMPTNAGDTLQVDQPTTKKNRNVKDGMAE